MTFKKHISLFLVFFISCSTSICDQAGQQAAPRQAAVQPAVQGPILAQVKLSPRPAGCDPGSGLRKPSRLLP